MKKRIISLFMVFIMLFSISACAGKHTDYGKDKNFKDVNIASLKGPTSMGLAKLYNDAGKDKKFNYKIVQTPDEIVAGLAKGEIDIAAVPANLASVLYNKTDGKLLKITNINTLGVLYIASMDKNVKTFKDLKGKVIVSSGKGATPEYILRELLINNKINPDRDVKIEYKSSHEEVVSSIVKKEADIALLPEPFLTAVETKVNFKNVISLNDVWKKSFNQDMITGVTVVRNEFLINHKDFVEGFLKDYKNSVEYVNENPKEASEIIGNLGIIDKNIAQKAIPSCNMVFIEGKDMIKALNKYYEVLDLNDKTSIGGKMPDEEIYYKEQIK